MKLNLPNKITLARILIVPIFLFAMPLPDIFLTASVFIYSFSNDGEMISL